MRRRWLLLPLLLAHLSQADEPRLWTSEFGIGGNLVQFQGINNNELWQGRLIALRLVLRGIVFDFRTQFTSVLTPADSPFRASAELRLGFSGRRWAVVAGAYLFDGLTTTPRFKPFPTARAEFSFGQFSLAAGLYDFHLPDVPFHLSLEGHDVGLGYVYPYGVEAHLRLRLAQFLGVTVQGMVLQRPGGDVVAYGSLMATIGVLSGKPPGPRAIIPPIFDPTR